MRPDLYQKNLSVLNSLYRISILVIDYIDLRIFFEAVNSNAIIPHSKKNNEGLA